MARRRRRHRGIGRAWKIAGVGGLAVVAVALAAAALAWDNRPAPESTHTRPTVTSAPAPEPTTAVVIGDSYTAGLRASAPSASWPRVFASTTGWVVTPLAVSGSGYTVEGPSEPGVFATRIPAAGDIAPDVLIFQGSINDLGADIAEPAGGALASARATLPDAACVVIGPTYIPQEGPERVDALNVALSEQAAANGCRYLDARTWVPLEQFADGAHPNDQGYATFAAAVKAELAP